MLKIIFTDNKRDELGHFILAAVNERKAFAETGDVAVKRCLSGSAFKDVLGEIETGDTPVFVVCDRFDGGDGRAICRYLRQNFDRAYIIYLAADNGDLPALTNDGVRLSGYVPYNDTEPFRKVLRNIFAEFAAHLKDDDRDYFIVRKNMGTKDSPNWRKLVFYARDVLYFTAVGGKTIMRVWNKKTENGADFEFDEALKGLAEAYKGRFVRCHNSFLVNAGWVAREKDGRPVFDHDEILLKNSEKVPVSDTYRRVVVKFFEEAGKVR